MLLSLIRAFSKMFRKATNLPFRFKESENTACVTCDHVLSRQRPILYVTHEKEDGMWQFLCGADSHTEATVKIVSLKQITVIDATVNDLFEMPLGVSTERESRINEWQPFQIK